jgi:hypothetical protein
MKKALHALALCGLAILGTGCLSFQSYGSPARGHSVSTGASRGDVFANMGEPDSIYSEGDTQVYVYKGIRGANYLGLYSKATRRDMVVVMDQKGIVISAVEVDMGRGHSLISPIFLDGTHPIRTTEITESPENYSVEKQ